MFGKNIPIKPLYSGGLSLRIIQIWRTIQGEGPLAGYSAIFIRLAGCNLRCHFCDTEFTEGAREIDIESVVEQVKFLSGGGAIDLVVLTGGEPLAQPVVPLIQRLAENHFHTQIETAGTVWQDGLEKLVAQNCATIVCSPKSATVHLKIEEYCDHWKYVIRASEVDPLDGLPAYSTQDPGKKTHLFRPSPHKIAVGGYGGDGEIWVQPCDEYVVVPGDGEEVLARDFDAMKNNSDACVRSAMDFGYRISLQMHKVLGVE